MLLENEQQAVNQPEVERYPSCVRCGEKYGSLGELFAADDGFVCEQCFDTTTDCMDEA